MKKIIVIVALGVAGNVAVAVTASALAPLPVNLPRPATLRLMDRDDHLWLSDLGWRGVEAGPWYCHVWTYTAPGFERRVFENVTRGDVLAQRAQAGWPVAWLEGGMVAEPETADWKLGAALPVGRLVRGQAGNFVPLRIAWGAFATTSLLYAAALAVLLGAARLARSLLRRRGDGCPKCGYPRGASVRCTECGAWLASSPRAKSTA
jgi:hypothetical protein